MGVSPVQSSQLNGLLVDHTVSTHNDNGVTCDLLLPTLSHVVQAHRARYCATGGNDISVSLTMQPRSSRHFSFQAHSHTLRPQTTTSTLEHQHRFRPTTTLTQFRQIVLLYHSSLCALAQSLPFSRFLALPGQEVPIQFLVECGVLNGPIPVASNPLNASLVLGVSASSRTQSTSLLNNINSACHGALTREAGNRIVQ